MFSFKKNMGTVDRSARIIVGGLLLLIGPASILMELPSVLDIVLGGLGTIALLSGVIGYCFLYEFTDSNTM